MSQYAKYKDLGDKTETFAKSNTESPLHLPNIVDNKHKRELIQGHRVCVIDIWADWCGPCKQIAPKFAKLADKYYKPGVCIFAKEEAQLELTPGITSIPVFHFFLDGKFVGDVLGGDIVAIEAKVRELLLTPEP